jgi:hypothetical protein
MERDRISPQVYLAIYCLSFMALGMFCGTMGPIIPYLSTERGIP